MNIQINIAENGTTTLATAGKYCDSDIDINIDVAESELGTFELALTNNLTAYRNENVTSIRPYAFRECTKLLTVDLPNLKSTGSHAFMGCTSIKQVDFPSLYSVGANTFQNCSSLESVNIPGIEIVSAYLFHSCVKLSRIELPSLKTLGAYGCTGCASLATIILGSSSRCSLSNINALQNTPIANGTGYIYVPYVLVDSYKTATNWSVYASQIRAIEDYPEITGG